MGKFEPTEWGGVDKKGGIEGGSKIRGAKEENRGDNLLESFVDWTDCERKRR